MLLTYDLGMRHSGDVGGCCAHLPAAAEPPLPVCGVSRAAAVPDALLLSACLQMQEHVRKIAEQGKCVQVGAKHDQAGMAH